MQTAADGTRLGLTIYEAGEVGGPGMGGCPDGPGGGITAVPPAPPVAYNPLNLANSVQNPNVMHGVVLFPERDMVVAGGFVAGDDLQIVVRRQDPANPDDPLGKIVGTARGIAFASPEGGMQEVNHPGGLCWSGQTPDVRPGDKVDVFKVVGGVFSVGDTQEVIGVAVTRAPYLNASNQLIIEGTMPEGFPLERMEQRIVNPEFRDAPLPSRLKDRTIRADTQGGRIRLDDGTEIGSGFLTLIPGTTNQWRATYTGLDATQRTLAARGQIRIMAWEALGAVDPTNGEQARLGLTIYEFEETNGPGFGGCPKTGSNLIPIPLP